jgi:hypothetical protein
MNVHQNRNGKQIYAFFSTWRQVQSPPSLTIPIFPVRVIFREHGLWFQPSQYGLKVKVKLSYLKDAPSHVNGEDDDEHHAFLTFVKVRCQLQDRTLLPRGKAPYPICIFWKTRKILCLKSRSNFGSSMVQPVCDHFDYAVLAPKIHLVCILYCGCFNLFVMCGWVYVGVFWQQCGCFGNVYLYLPCFVQFVQCFCSFVYVYLFLLVLSVLV